MRGGAFRRNEIVLEVKRFVSGKTGRHGQWNVINQGWAVQSSHWSMREPQNGGQSTTDDLGSLDCMTARDPQARQHVTPARPATSTPSSPAGAGRQEQTRTAWSAPAKPATTATA